MHVSQMYRLLFENETRILTKVINKRSKAQTSKDQKKNESKNL